MIINEDDFIAHYGTPRHSGRYPWGSGGEDGAFPRNASFADTVADLKRQGITESEIATGFGIGTTDRNGVFKPSTTQLRARVTIDKNKRKMDDILQAQKLHDKGLSNVAGAAQMGIPESSFRALLAPGAKERAEVLTATSDHLKGLVDSKTYLDVGSGVENYLGISKEKLGAAVAILREQGYQTHNVPILQQGTGHDTKTKVLVPPGVTWGEVMKNRDKIQQIRDFSEDGGHTFTKQHPPIAIDPKRIGINYKEDGGKQADGVIYVRPGVEDVSIGSNRYAQVRIQVGDNHYLKGMATYKDDMPPGVDLIFNTDKSDTGNKLDAMKPLKRDNDGNIDKDLPFGAIVRQLVKDPGTPNEHVTSAMNMVGMKPGAGEEGSWSTWANTLSSQFLSKQSPSLAKAQLNVTHDGG